MTGIQVHSNQETRSSNKQSRSNIIIMWGTMKKTNGEKKEWGRMKNHSLRASLSGTDMEIDRPTYGSHPPSYINILNSLTSLSNPPLPPKTLSVFSIPCSPVFTGGQSNLCAAHTRTIRTCTPEATARSPLPHEYPWQKRIEL